MKKIILGIFVLALMLSTTAFAAGGRNRGNNASSTPRTVDSTCVAAAVTAREDAVIAAWNTLNTKIVSILNARKASLTEAWGLSDKAARKSAVKAAWDKARNDRKAAGTELKNAKQTAWSTFKNSVKACGGTAGTEAAGEKDSTENIAI